MIHKQKGEICGSKDLLKGRLQTVCGRMTRIGVGGGARVGILGAERSFRVGRQCRLQRKAVGPFWEANELSHYRAAKSDRGTMTPGAG